MGFWFKPNKTFAEGGGLTSILIPKQLGKGGVAVGMGVLGVGAVAEQAFASHNRLKAGPIRYGGGPARMTNQFSSGMVEAINNATDDPAIKADMINHIMHNRTDGALSNLEQHGINQDFMNAFYGMM